VRMLREEKHAVYLPQVTDLGIVSAFVASSALPSRQVAQAR
jgi:hypothetical protein